MFERTFILGEEKYLDFKVTSRKGETIVILSANYALLDFYDNEKTIKDGVCEIDGDNISILLEPPTKGDYIVELTYVVAPETRKARVILHVV